MYQDCYGTTEDDLDWTSWNEAHFDVGANVERQKSYYTDPTVDNTCMHYNDEEDNIQFQECYGAWYSDDEETGEFYEIQYTLASAFYEFELSSDSWTCTGTGCTSGTEAPPSATIGAAIFLNHDW